ncbi:MAG: hypothetical protein V3V18_10410 [Methylococcales bacterium]
MKILHIKKMIPILGAILLLNIVNVYADEVTIEFETATPAIFGEPRGNGYIEKGFATLPIASVDGFTTLHVHGKNAEGDQNKDKELVHHADAGGWFITRENPEAGAFSVNTMEIAKLDYVDNRPGGIEQPLVIDGYLADQKVATVELFEDDNNIGDYLFPDTFQNIDRMEVYFKSWRGLKPEGSDPQTGAGGEADYNIIVDNIVIGTAGGTIPVTTDNIIPKDGLWWNPARSGHGIDVQYDGANLIMVWYTYNDDGTPTWYLASGPLSGKTWTSSLDTFVWDGTKASPTSVGTATIDFKDETHADFSWVINGTSGTEPFEFLVTSSDQTLNDYTGIWFEPAKPGYGLSVSNQGNTEFSVLYFYDDQGQPVWALGVNEGNTATYTLDQFTEGFCPNCELKVPVTKTVGTLTREFTSQSAGVISIDFDLVEPLSGPWKINDAQINNLSNP